MLAKRKGNRQLQQIWSLFHEQGQLQFFFWLLGSLPSNQSKFIINKPKEYPSSDAERRHKGRPVVHATLSGITNVKNLGGTFPRIFFEVPAINLYRFRKYSKITPA